MSNIHKEKQSTDTNISLKDRAVPSQESSTSPGLGRWGSPPTRVSYLSERWQPNIAFGFLRVPCVGLVKIHFSEEQ